jgi:hypothetical protein
LIEYESDDNQTDIWAECPAYEDVVAPELNTPTSVRSVASFADLELSARLIVYVLNTESVIQLYSPETTHYEVTCGTSAGN